MSATIETRRLDVYNRVTNQIIEALERGVKPWTQPWKAAIATGHVSRPLCHNGQPYAGINVLTLWAAAMTAHYTAPIWMTFKQAIELGGNVRQGEKGSPVVYADSMRRTETDEATGDETERTMSFLKAYTVFNVQQVDGLPEHFHALAIPQHNPVQRIADAETFFAATRADIRHGGDCAYYSSVLDYIQMPPFEVFYDAQAYYATLAHEATHWTRHMARLNRGLGRKRFGDDGYAREELVAELGAAFLCADLGLRLDDRTDHAAYIGHWLSVLKEDKRTIFAVAAHAQRAADYLKRFSRPLKAVTKTIA